MPTNGRYLLDTNIVIGLLSGEDAIVRAVSAAPSVFLPVVVAGELFFGAVKSGRPQANLEVIERFLVGRVLLPCDVEVARRYGRLKNALKSKGTPLPENDVWIAARALHHDLTLATRDRHFAQVDELRMETS